MSGWFDVYFGTKAGKLTRLTTLRPITPNYPWDWSSDDLGAIDWSIPYFDANGSPTINGTFTGFPAFGGKVWTIENRFTPSSHRYVVQYDSLLRSIVSEVEVPFAFGTQPQMQVRALPLIVEQPAGILEQTDRGATSQTTLAIYSVSSSPPAGTLHLVTGGQYTTTSAAYRFTTGNTEQGVTCFAWRNWPRGAGYLKTVNGFSTSISQLYIGDIIVQNGHLDLANKQIVISGSNGTTYDWLSFDSSDTHWAGAVRKFNELTQAASLLLMIDGQIITETPYTGPSVAATGIQYAEANYYGEPHVCHPHETLGDGWVAIPTNSYTFSSGDSSKRWEIVVYHNGVEAWRTGRLWPYVANNSEQNHAPIVNHSSDRWLYVDNFDTQNYTSIIPDHWKHDGSQKWITGKLTAGGTTTLDHITAGGVGRVQVNHNRAVVQNSIALGNSLPLDFPPP